MEHFYKLVINPFNKEMKDLETSIELDFKDE